MHNAKLGFKANRAEELWFELQANDGGDSVQLNGWCFWSEG
jgi:hypothetical protein